MAKKDRLRNTYYNALKQAGYDLTGEETMSKMRKTWKDYRSLYTRENGTKAPSVYQYSREYQEAQAPTIDFGMDYIRNFINKVWDIYHNTISWIESNKEGTHESGKLASIAEYRIYNNDLYNSAWQVEKEIKAYLDSGVPAEVLAQAMAENVELDYTVAVALQPPSDIVFLFDETVEQLKGIWGQINSKLQELAQAEEDKYYGR